MFIYSKYLHFYYFNLFYSYLNIVGPANVPKNWLKDNDELGDLR